MGGVSKESLVTATLQKNPAATRALRATSHFRVELRMSALGADTCNERTHVL